MSSHSSHAAPSLPPTPYAGSARRRGEWDSPRRTATPRGATSSTIPPTPASSSQLVRSSEVKPSYSLLRQEILSEEEYVSHLSDIIKRDFFPHLSTLDAQHEVLQAWESEDPIRIEESVRRMREICTPTPRRRAQGRPLQPLYSILEYRADPRAARPPPEGATPGRTPFDSASVSATPTYFDRTPMTSTPLPSSSSSSRAAAPPRVDTSLSLDAFQSRYTSHDNSSFAVLLARDNAARREKHAWAWEAEAKANARAVRGRQARERLVDVTRKMVEGSEGGTVLMLDGGPGRPGERRLLVDSSVEVGEGDRLMITGRDEKERLRITDGRDGERRDKGKDKGKEVERVDERAKQYVDWDKPTVEEEEEGKPLREEELQVETQGWPFTNRNSLMFAPDADALPHARPPQPSAAEDPSNPNPIPLGEPKGIRYHATRLMELERGSGDGEGGTPSPSRSRIGAAIAGTPYPSTSAASTTPRALQELMTWGTIDATPVTLRTTGEDSSVGPFRIKDSSKREALAHKMARKAKRSLAESATGGRGLAVDARGGAAAGLRKSVLDPSAAGRASPAGSSRGPGSPRPSATDLSPAARNLLGRTKPGRALEGGLGRTKQWGDEEERRRVERAKARAREVEGRERLRRERWTLGARD
ncbi:SPOSA6832_04378 [Sporobolomyces salmonicolor]|uniref:SPOSA6832_04378-mRNA-1:cds n=1 Tax=Sporidiobolus salmonicolor TaxID=5005 RepID=A0A0D6ERH4_SPOSA|nr:SPOSA6832_04378 [Sporobolomyces salmonicolor]